MSSVRCANCSKPALAGKLHCLDHHKEQANYAYGMDHDLQQKMAAKFDPAKVEAVRVWIEAVTKRKLESDLQAALKSGVVLCELMNAIWPGSISKIQQSSMPFVQRENIVAYLNACKAKGMRETDLFVTGDLFEGANMVSVVDQLCALGYLAASKGYNGPKLLIKGGAVQVAGGATTVKAPAPAQVPLYEQRSPAASPPAASSPPAAASPAGGAKFCGNCGSKRADMSLKFCGNCGNKF